MAFIIMIFGALLVFSGIRELLKSRRLLSTGLKAVAVVIRHNAKNSGGKVTSYYPVITFTTGRREVIEHQMQEGSNPPVPVGTEVEIIYDPEKPTVFSKNTGFALSVRPYLIMALGAAGILGGIWMYLGR